MTERTDKKSAGDDLDELLRDDSHPAPAKKPSSQPAKPPVEEDEWGKPGKKVSEKDLLEPDTFGPGIGRRGVLTPPKSAQPGGGDEEDPEEMFAGMLKSGPKMVVLSDFLCMSGLEPTQ